MGEKTCWMIKNRFSLFALLVILNLLAASCGINGYECTDPLGCLEIPSGHSLIIGTILATSGPQGQAGTEALQSLEKIVSEMDELLGHPIELVHIDTDCSLENARSAATELTTLPGISAVIGPTCPVETELANSILLDAGIPLLGPVPDAGTARDLFSKLISKIESVAVQVPDLVLYIPRQALLEALLLP
jgi:ABC-type branched-subunit amino acid transport system substrate-binding protein